MEISKKIATLTLCILACSTLLAQTQPAATQAEVKTPSAPSAVTQELATGEVLKVYLKEKTLLLKHGAIPSLGMSPMTMAYEVADPEMLALVKSGSKVRFMAAKVEEEYKITHIELAN